MDETEFWEIIDSTREAADGDPEDHADLLVERLTQLDPDSVLDFARHFEARYNRAYAWDLWGAAAVLLGGASDDAFDWFRCWLIGQGRERSSRGRCTIRTPWRSCWTTSTRRSTGTARSWATRPTRRTSSSPGWSRPTWGCRRSPPSRWAPGRLRGRGALAARFPELWDRFGPR